MLLANRTLRKSKMCCRSDEEVCVRPGHIHELNDAPLQPFAFKLGQNQRR